jgi:glucose-1-phosphate adenylyltransferase
VRKCLALVLAGGEGKRLFPITRERSKPAVYFGGRYRLIDFVLSNLVNSGFQRIKVITQYRSTSLVRHLNRAWPVASALLDQFVEPVPAAMNLGPNWFAGTADAIWQNLDLLRDTNPDDVLIFGADHIYKMDVGLMLEEHRNLRADLTVATLAMPRDQAYGFGCLEVDEAGRVLRFLEKPDNPPPIPDRPDHTLVSMGNYIFRTRALINELRRDAESNSSHDFGRDILSSAHERMEVYAYDFSKQLCPGESEQARGYWRDVGTIDAYYAANMDLVSVDPALNLYNGRWPIRGVQPLTGPAKFVFSDSVSGRIGSAQDSLVGSGTIISGGQLRNSVAFQEVRLNSYCEVESSILFPKVSVGRGARLHRCIVDKGVNIPADFVAGLDPEKDRAQFTVSDSGVVVISREDLGQTDEYDVEHAEGESSDGND